MNDTILYWNKEVAELLGIGDSTLRKWCILLEERGYPFLKDEHNRGTTEIRVILGHRLTFISK